MLDQPFCLTNIYHESGGYCMHEALCSVILSLLTLSNPQAAYCYHPCIMSMAGSGMKSLGDWLVQGCTV